MGPSQQREPRTGCRWLVALLLVVAAGCGREKPEPPAAPAPAAKPPGRADVLTAIRAAEARTPPQRMAGHGLAAARGGVNLKAQRAGTYDLTLSLPQSVDSQVPVFYDIAAQPPESLADWRVQVREDGNAFVHLKLDAKQQQEIALEWTAVVLVAPVGPAQDPAVPEPFLAASPCAQADSLSVEKLAAELWPESGRAQEYAVRIQDFIGKMERRAQPRSLDAVGILASGCNTICTANANLACALMRARRIPCRSVATLPTISCRFEMHRIVEFHEGGAWVPFDPSRVYPDIPLQPWQNVIMAKTSIADEQISMMPRMGAMFGCPFGQEAEFGQPGLSFFGPGFFWTIALPLAEFEATEEACLRSSELWEQYLKTRTLSAAQLAAALARTSGQYLTAIRAQ